MRIQCVALREGVFAIASGFYDIVLVGGLKKCPSAPQKKLPKAWLWQPCPTKARPGSPFRGVRSDGHRIFAKYRADRESLFNVTIKSHNNARLNPRAQYRASIRDILDAKIARAREKGLEIPTWQDEKAFLRDPVANPVVAWPMHLFDCCPISDGASCALLVGEELARNFTDDPLHVIGLGQGSGRGLHAKADLTTFEATRYAAQEAYGMAGLSPDDIQIAEVHDCFSIAEIVHMEDLGFSSQERATRPWKRAPRGSMGRNLSTRQAASNAKAIQWEQPVLPR